MGFSYQSFRQNYLSYNGIRKLNKKDNDLILDVLL